MNYGNSNTGDLCLPEIGGPSKSNSSSSFLKETFTNTNQVHPSYSRLQFCKKSDIKSGRSSETQHDRQIQKTPLSKTKTKWVCLGRKPSKSGKLYCSIRAKLQKKKTSDSVFGEFVTSELSDFKNNIVKDKIKSKICNLLFQFKHSEPDSVKYVQVSKKKRTTPSF